MNRLSRREFLAIGGGVTATSALLLSGCGGAKEVRRLYATLTREEEMKLGRDTWYATTCQECSAGCGLLVRTLDGRAKKIEGNPLHPLNRGKTCARAQAALQGLYNPDRHEGPLRRSGPRGSASFDRVTWDEAIGSIAPEIGGDVLFLSGPVTGNLHWLIHSFMGAVGSERLYFLDTFGPDRLRWTHRVAYGQETLPHYDLARADLIISFGAPFLETWLSPVHFSRGYGAFRQGDSGTGEHNPWGRGTLIQIEPRLSMTAAAADRWEPIRPGTEGLLALALANLLSPPGDWQPLLSSYSTTSVADRCGIRAERIEEMAESLERARAPLILGGGAAEGTTNGAFNLLAIHLLNRLLMERGKEVPIRANPPSPLAGVERFAATGDGTSYRAQRRTFRDLESLGEEILDASESPVRAVFLHGIDPLQSLPGSSLFRKAMERIPLIVSFAPYPDETSGLADWILPDHTSLESWGDSVPGAAPGGPVLGLCQPVVRPRLDTRATGDVLLELARAAGRELPWQAFRDVVQAGLRDLHRLEADRLEGISSTTFEEGLLAKGGWFAIPGDGDWTGPMAKAVPAEPPPFPVELLAAQEASFEGDANEFPFVLLPYPSALLGQGEGANRPWLQEAGDPMTSIAWGSWLEVNPHVAASLGLSEGDLVEVESPTGQVVLPVYPYPGIGPDVVAVPCGQGNELSGRYAKDRGANPLQILSPHTDETTGDFAWIATSVRLRPLGRRGTVVKYEGSARELGGEDHAG